MDWNERYNEAGFAYGMEPNGFLVSVVDEIPQGKILCLCEGEGRNAVFLAQHGYDVTGVDASEVGLAKAQQLAADKGVVISTVVSNLQYFEMEDEAWDAIVSIFCHVPPDIRPHLHRRCVAALRPGGVFILEAYTAKQVEYGTGGPPTVDNTMSLIALKDELKGLEILHGVEIDRDVIEGKYHTGRGAVVQVIARKL